MAAKWNKKDSEEYYEENEERYQEEFDATFNENFKDFIECPLNIESETRTFTKEDVEEFMDSFIFPTIENWMASEYQSAMDAWNDSLYEEEKERRAGYND